MTKGALPTFGGYLIISLRSSTSKLQYADGETHSLASVEYCSSQEQQLYQLLYPSTNHRKSNTKL